MVAAELVVAHPRTAPAYSYQIEVSGLVARNLTLSLGELRSMPNATVTSELICVSGHSYGIHTWTGVRLSYLLREAGVEAGAVKVAFNATDDYSTDLTMQDAMRDDVLVAFLEDGIPFRERTRLVVPGDYGYKWITNIVSIQVLDFDYKGTYESGGYADDASITDF
jgi:DMSO/TMAO reductase YedYZ molybdopterin-dependent catalytic subunit